MNTAISMKDVLTNRHTTVKGGLSIVACGLNGNGQLNLELEDAEHNHIQLLLEPVAAPEITPASERPQPDTVSDTEPESEPAPEPEPEDE